MIYFKIEYCKQINNQFNTKVYEEKFLIRSACPRRVALLMQP